MSLRDEIERMLQDAMKADPLVLDYEVLGDNREVTIKDSTELMIRISAAQNSAILRLADEIDKLA